MRRPARITRTDTLFPYTTLFRSRATLSDVGPAPRIPPLRLLGGLELKQGDVWALRGEVEHATRQDRVAANETPTAAYTLTTLAVQWMPLGDRITLTVAANNMVAKSEARRVGKDGVHTRRSRLSPDLKKT